MVKKWVIEETKEILKAYIFRYKQNICRSADSGKVGTFDVVECLNWANVIPVTDDNKVVMVEQYRHGTDQITLEIPGGAISRGEDTLVGIKRELMEETGYSSDDWELVGTIDVNPAFMTNSSTTYFARGCKLTGEQNLDHLEEVDVRLVDLEDILPLIEEGKITHSLIIAAFGQAKFQNKF
jgi:ADP-ribose pyrophosphatase